MLHPRVGQLTRVELGEGKADKAISVGILNKRLGDLVGELNGLVLDRDTSNGNGVCAHDTSGARTVAVANFPLSTVHLLERSRLGRIKSSVLTNELRVKLGAETPTVRYRLVHGWL